VKIKRIPAFFNAGYLKCISIVKKELTMSRQRALELLKQGVGSLTANFHADQWEAIGKTLKV
jgi:hypothetical protein